MQDGQTISDCRIQQESTLHLTLLLTVGGDGFDLPFYSGGSGFGLKNLFCSGGGGFDREKFVFIAQAISLWDWDGIMPGPVSLTSVVCRQVDLLLLLRVIMQLAFGCPRATS